MLSLLLFALSRARLSSLFGDYSIFFFRPLLYPFLYTPLFPFFISLSVLSLISTTRLEAYCVSALQLESEG